MTTPPDAAVFLRTALETSKAAWQSACDLRDRLRKDRAEKELLVTAEKVVASTSATMRSLEAERMRRWQKSGRSPEDLRSMDRLADAHDRAARGGR